VDRGAARWHTEPAHWDRTVVGKARLTIRCNSSRSPQERKQPVKVSHEAAVLKQLEAAVGDTPGGTVHRGLRAANRFGIPGWELSPGQRFQFGDLRIETDHVTLVVEAESAGGVTNLAKYWPLLATGAPPKRFVLAHLFLTCSKSDFISHRSLWSFQCDRMREDLEGRGVLWGRDWEAALFTYTRVEEPTGAVQFIRSVVIGGEPAPLSGQ
jgi:hypothetical protein